MKVANAAERMLAKDVSLAVVGERGEFTFFGRGITPLVHVLEEQPEILIGASVADKIVGRAAALLMALGGVKEVYATVMSDGAREALSKRAIVCSYGVLTDNIINRAGTDICPMEKAVQGIDDPVAAFKVIKASIAAL